MALPVLVAVGCIWGALEHHARMYMCLSSLAQVMDGMVQPTVLPSVAIVGKCSYTHQELQILRIIAWADGLPGFCVALCGAIVQAGKAICTCVTHSHTGVE